MEDSTLDARKRKNVQVGSQVKVVQKQHQKSGKLTQGIVKKILTKSSNHPYGIKVQLVSGEVGRVKKIYAD